MAKSPSFLHPVVSNTAPSKSRRAKRAQLLPQPPTRTALENEKKSPAIAGLHIANLLELIADA
jgi:hypothetical protein